MAYSILSFIDENQFVGEWLHRKALSNKLLGEKNKAESMVKTESTSSMTVDGDLQKYSGALAGINDDLKVIHSLREEESRLNGEIATAESQLQKAKKTKKTLITLAVIAVIAIGIAIAVMVFMKPSAQTEQVEEEVAVENIQN